LEKDEFKGGLAFIEAGPFRLMVCGRGPKPEKLAVEEENVEGNPALLKLRCWKLVGSGYFV
jgi:hypothetical protein